MMELPNYSSQLLQQLWALRKEDCFCDCTILVGDSPHRAHKLVLAASSILFRSLLDGSDTISIDTAVVSSLEFGCLLDMVYTGKLPLGKHNVSRIIAAADNLQMFDVAVGFKNVLTSLVNQHLPSSVVSTQTANHSTIHKVQTPSPEGLASSDMNKSTSDETELNTEPQREDCQGDGGEAQEQLLKSSAPEEAEPPETTGEENNPTAAITVANSESAPGLECFSQFMEIFTNMSSVQELLRQAAQSNLGEEERQVVCQCCEEADPKLVLEKLMSYVNEGQLSKEIIIRLLRTVQQTFSNSIPPSLPSMLEEDGNTVEPREDQTTKSESQSSTNNEGKLLKEEEVENMEEETTNNENDFTNTNESSSSPTSPSKSPSTPYSCRWCKKGFAYKCRMLAHVKRCSMSKDGEQQCPQCHKKFANQRALQRHRAEAHRNTLCVKKKVACDLCGRIFAHPSGLIYHKRTEHFEEKPFACEDCGAKFGANSSLKNHMRLHTGEKPYQCKHCDMSFSVAAALAYHTKKKHSEGKMYVCQYCKAIFAQSIELTRHVRTHTGDRPYVCRECGKGYSQASGLTVHLHTFHNMSEPHDCQKCCLSFPTLEEHQQHIQEFHPKEFHKCPTCNKVFTSSVLLDKHKATHAGVKPFSCDLCNKSYQQVSGLWYHNRTHHPEVYANHTRQLKTLVQCDLCFKFFPSTGSLAKHRASEHQGSPALALQCSYCSAVFGREEELQDHVNTQHSSKSGEVFSCQLCNLVCPTQLELQEHLLSSHLETQGIPESGKEAPSPHTAIQADPTDVSGAESVLSEEQAQMAAAQQVLVALTGGREVGSSADVLEVNMYDLLNNTVTLICEDKTSTPHVEP